MSDRKLKEYSAKRSFGYTPEPRPAEVERSGPLMFVVQQHSARRMHYDFRLECDGVLKSWAVPKGPSPDPQERRLAVQTEDHPFDYASFEGVIPPGQYGAGEVIVWDCGVYSPDDHNKDTCFDDREEAERRIRDGLKKGKLSFQLRGEKLKGSYTLVRTGEEKNWFLIKHKDRYVSKEDITVQDRSVLSSISVEEMAAMPVDLMPAERLAVGGKTVPMPAKLEPMHAESEDAPFNDPDWMWEPKLDGYRVLAFIARGEVRLCSRRGLDVSNDFPKLRDELLFQDTPMILDGELVGFEGGRPSFNALQNKKGPFVFYCFDLLYFAGVDVRKFPYLERRRYLAQCLLPTPAVQLVHAVDDGVELYEVALKSGFEGVIGKKKRSVYESGKRSSAWLKVKSTHSEEFLIGGYTKGKGSRDPLGSLLVGRMKAKKLHYAGHVGSGFDEKSVPRVLQRLEALQTKECPFAGKPPLHRPTTWVKPELVAEVKFQEWTKDGYLRAPVFLRLRDDIALPEKNSLLEQLETPKASFTIEVEGHAIKLTHMDREYWPAEPALKQPALTKRDLLRYLAEVHTCILPHLVDRPLTMIRMPEGIHVQRFFQKHWRQEKPKFVESITVFSEHKDESHDYLLCNNLPTLLWLAQSGTLEFHVWHSRAALGDDTEIEDTDYATSLESLEASILNYPDFVVFDIDPYIYSGKEKAGDEPELNTVAFEKGKEIAFRVRELLNTMGLDPVVKTSGKTGLHVFLPIRRTIDFDTARAVSENVGRHLMRKYPKDITMEWSVPKRTGKIFMDYNMNVRGKTLNVAYSPRGAAGAPVSMPLTWDELKKAHPLDFRITNAAEWVKPRGDRWKDMLRKKQSLEKALKT